MGKLLYDVVIIGAGPIGSILAHRLAVKKFRVLVLEKKNSVREKICCTGIISKECYHKLSLDNDIIIRKASSAHIYCPSGRNLRFWRDEDIAYITDRPILNQKLSDKAHSAGADFRYSAQVTDIQQKSSNLLIQTDGNDGKTAFSARSAVIATGYGTNLIGKLGFPQIKRYSIGAQAKVELAGTSEVEIFIDNTMFPGGFGWLVPTISGKGLAGFLGQIRYRPDLKLKDFLTRLKKQGKIGSDDVVGDFAIIPLKPLTKTYGERLLITGEAAGQVKPLTGGGIYYGVLCAEIASHVLDGALTSDNLTSQNLEKYQKLWQAKMGREIAISVFLQRIWAKLNNKYIEYAFNIIDKKHIPELIANTQNFSFDWHSQLLLQVAKSFLPFTRF